MHICFAHNDYGSFSGEEEAVEKLSGLLASRGHRLSWLRRSSAVIGDSFAMKARALASGVYSRAARTEMAGLLARERPELVQVQNLYPFLSPSILLACRDAGVPVVMRCPNYRLFCPSGLHLREGRICDDCLGPGREWHCLRHNCEGSWPKSAGYAVRNAVARTTGMITEHVARFIVLSKFQMQRFIAAGIPASRLAVLPNVAPVPATAPPAPPRDGVVAYIGRLSREKGIGELVEAARRLPHVRFAAAGSVSPDVQAIVAAAPENFRLLGFVSGAALDRLMEESRMVVSPSLCFEGFPNAIVRAMGHARPVVATRLGGVPEIVADGETGLLCDPADAAALATCIRRLWDDPAACEAMGAAGRERASREYSEERVYGVLMEIYADAQSCRRDPRARSRFPSADVRAP